MGATRRMFVGVRVPPLSRLHHLADELLGLGSALRVVPSKNWHLTLKFLGDTSTELAGQVVELLQRIAVGMPPVNLQIVGTGLFPDLRRPKVVWAGIEPRNALDGLVVEFETGCEALGFARETRTWHAHLTLAYVKHRPPDELETLLHRTATTHFGEIDVRQLELIESTLTPEGPIYSTVAAVPLQSA
jgi:RNA 2',3'-cyclic 3'-phosphodiesterase